ncbi:MAG: alkaline phosphatase D family protein [Gammaproteobacteria bacterium]
MLMRNSGSARGHGLAKFLLLLLALTTTASALDDWQPLPDREVTRIAFGSCAKQWQAQPIWQAVVGTKPDLFLFIGDAIYGDWHGDKPFTPTRDSLEADWNKLAEIPEFEAVRNQVPFMATWDNHDYGSHNGGAEFPLKEMTRNAFLDFFGEPGNSVRRTSAGIYDAKVFGPAGQRVQVILLDTRWFKGPFVQDPRPPEQRKAIGRVGKYAPNTDADAALLGEAQWQWLETQLRQPAEVRLIVSSTQVVANEKGMDEWGVFPRERQRLFDLIGETGAKGVLLLSGNVHFSEVSRWGGGSYPLYDFTSSGMTHVNAEYAAAPNRHRVAGPFVELNFGLLEIDWEAPSGPMMRMKALGVDGQAGFEHEVALEALQ